MYKSLLLSSVLFVAVGCENKSEQAPLPADNSGVNARDTKASSATPGDQGENDIDRTISQKIRQGVMKSDTLSMTAKNVKIITAGSVVTLRGPVKSDKEKSDIANIAQTTEGVKSVNNMLEIAAN